jgi:diguanylate cyclase (GGDEF)-like protein
MPFFDTTTKRFFLRIGLPAILILLATFAIVVISLEKMAGEVNRIEDTLNGRSTTAALQSLLRRLGESHDDYAEWDDAVRNLYGAVNTDWAMENIASSTIFDTFYLVDENGNALLAYRNGEPVSTTPVEAFGPSLATMIADLPTDGTTYDVKTGIVKGAWGLATIAVGPVVPVSDSFPNPPQRSRYMVIGNAFDDAAVHRMSEDFLIDGLRLVDPAASEPLEIDLTDPNGTIVGALTRSPGRLGSQAHAQVSPAVLTVLALVGITMAFLIAFGLRGWREVQKRQVRLDAALNNMAHGLCMFDADQRLVTFNRRFAEIFHIPPDKVASGLLLPQLMELARNIDKDPEATLAAQRALLDDPSGGNMVSNLTDGRIISIAHRPMKDGGFVATFEDSTERILAEQRIRYLAHYDALTDLPNRMAFYERMEAILTHLRRFESMAVLSLDLDHFKNVNDTLGHPVGDLLLKAAAERMRSCVRDEDIVARLGGDEFAIVRVSSAAPEDITALATRLIEVVGAPYDLDDRQVVVGVSVGIAIAPADGGTPDIVMKNTDLALYRAKANGGGGYCFFEVAMDARMQARRALELDLRKAVAKGEFEVYYQPVVDVKTGQVSSCEALIRWRHPERGMIPPAEFIRIAEETGLIVPIGEWVLRQACAEAVRWPEHVSIAVNLSPAQFKSRNLLPTVISALAASGLPAGRLELEITETVLLQDNEGAFEILYKLRDLGITIGMDDFGTGYSSLGYLRSFPFDRIKIDQTFIRDLPTEEYSVAIVRAVVGLGSSLGMTTIAEGVETKEQLASLAAEGCNEFQGFLFSAAQPAAEVERILAERNPPTAAVA